MNPFYLDVDGTAHQANFDANTQANMRLVALTMRDNGGNPLYSAAWVPSDGRGWVACQGEDFAGLQAFYNKWSAQGMEMKILTSTETLFSAVMEATATGTKFVSGLTDATLAGTLQGYQQSGNNYAPRAFAIYGAPGPTRQYAAIFEPCAENWTYGLWLTDSKAPQTIDAYFNDLRYRPTLLTYSPDSFLFCVFRDNSIGSNNWTAGNALTGAALTAMYNSFSLRGLWPLSLSVNDNDTFACVMVTTETPLARQFSCTSTSTASDLANLAGTIDPQIEALMQGNAWNTVGKPRVIAVAIAYQQRLMFAKAYTYADSTYPIAGPTSLFRLASCSKPITSVAIGRLLQDNLLTNADSLQMIGLEPAPGGIFPAAFDTITVAELRSHRSGLQPANSVAPNLSSPPPDSAVAAAYGNQPTPITVYELISYWLTNASINAGFPSTANLSVQYQNCNYALLGLLVRAATKGLYATYVQEKIFSPLGLTRPNVGASLHTQRATLEVQHHSSGPSSVGPNLVTADPPLVGSGYGTYVSENLEGFEDWSFSTVDYAAVLAAVGVANPGNYPILNGASIATLFTQIDPTGVANNFTLGGLFWRKSPKGITVYGHNGGWGVGGANIATWVISRSDGVSAAVFMNMDDPGPLGDFVWGEQGANAPLSGQLQAILDAANWPAAGDLFPSFGVTPF